MVDIIINKNGSQSLKSEKENTITMLESELEIMKEAGLILDEIASESLWNDSRAKRASNRLFKVINKYNYGKSKAKAMNITKNEWEKGFREGANHSFSYFCEKSDNQDIKELDGELKYRIKIAVGKNKVSSVLNEK